MKRIKKQYQAYLLRCWREDTDDLVNRPQWRISIETSDGRNIRRGFTRLQDLLLFLKDDLDLQFSDDHRSSKQS